MGCNTLYCAATWCTGRACAGDAGDLVVRVQHERRRRRGRATRARHLCVSPSSLLTASVAASPTTPLPTDQLTQLQACSGTAMQRYGLVVLRRRFVLNCGCAECPSADDHIVVLASQALVHTATATLHVAYRIARLRRISSVPCTLAQRRGGEQARSLFDMAARRTLHVALL